jgi:putative ABC transport system permease protein
MQYTFAKAGNALQIGADVAALKAALPTGAVTGFDSWLGSVNQTSAETSVDTPFVVTFALIGLVLAVLIVASVVSGAVAASYQRIGVLKSIGFTPLQVAIAYAAQIGAPALAGVAAGTAAGNLWVTPTLNKGVHLFLVLLAPWVGWAGAGTAEASDCVCCVLLMVGSSGRVGCLDKAQLAPRGSGSAP